MAKCDNYYELPAIWGTEISEEDKDRIKKILSFIPHEINSVLDLGCGDGILTNILIEKYPNTMAFDISREALSYVKESKIQGTIDRLPFKDLEFDLIINTEVLEHLPRKVLINAVNEMQRCTSNIIISVPFDESIEELYVKCGHCGCVFHPWRHLNSFDLEKLNFLFSDFTLVSYLYCGTTLRVANKYRTRLRQFFQGWTKPQNAFCPQCGENEIFVTEKNIFINIINLINRAHYRIYKKQRKYWIVLYYKRKNK